MKDTAAYDLVIVGASFAGLACARAAAIRGLRTLVIEAKTDPGARISTTGIIVKEAADENRHSTASHAHRAWRPPLCAVAALRRSLRAGLLFPHQQHRRSDALDGARSRDGRRRHPLLDQARPRRTPGRQDFPATDRPAHPLSRRRRRRPLDGGAPLRPRPQHPVSSPGSKSNIRNSPRPIRISSIASSIRDWRAAISPGWRRRPASSRWDSPPMATSSPTSRRSLATPRSFFGFSKVALKERRSGRIPRSAVPFRPLRRPRFCSSAMPLAMSRP
jgi:hypothetical protein